MKLNIYINNILQFTYCPRSPKLKKLIQDYAQKYQTNDLISHEFFHLHQENPITNHLYKKIAEKTNFYERVHLGISLKILIEKHKYIAYAIKPGKTTIPILDRSFRDFWDKCFIFIKDGYVICHNK